MRRSDDPSVLVAMQCLIGAAGAATAVGSWTGARWAAAAAVCYGALTAGMLVALEAILTLGSGARAGLWVGATMVLLFALGSAWYLRRDR